jgi:hypothetical protein
LWRRFGLISGSREPEFWFTELFCPWNLVDCPSTSLLFFLCLVVDFMLGIVALLWNRFNLSCESCTSQRFTVRLSSGSLSLSLSQGSDLWKDRDRFKSFAQASLELCKVYIEIYSSTSSHRELRAAEMHLKNIIKQARYLNFDVWEKLTLEHLLRFPFNLIKCRAADILAYVLVYHFCVTLIL